ncbi:hypothetical protein BDZ91DRAFT_727906 [Kalaharituber pfeilii]|nr:hypothetical protein BDZ91DRAFT_727906 [Kalaharituber pfeilii]
MALSIKQAESNAAPVFLSFSMDSAHAVFNFSFPIPQSATPASAGYSTFCRKRARPLADIDGHCREVTKKRRLRLAFVTSRLSAPFASPPRNNVDRGNSKIAIWAKQRAAPQHQFRKMAILNRIKREAMALREAQQRQIEIARQQNLEKMMAAPPRRSSKRLQLKKSAKQVTVEEKIQELQRVCERPVREYRKIAPDPNHTPLYRRPPTPPSEEELERQRKQRKRR